jgi:hypothetical protein
MSRHVRFTSNELGKLVGQEDGQEDRQANEQERCPRRMVRIELESVPVSQIRGGKENRLEPITEVVSGRNTKRSLNRSHVGLCISVNWRPPLRIVP